LMVEFHDKKSRVWFAHKSAWKREIERERESRSSSSRRKGRKERTIELRIEKRRNEKGKHRDGERTLGPIENESRICPPP
jgi:hypothetical protein